MRTFIAIEVSEEILNTLAQIQDYLKYAGADVKWIFIQKRMLQFIEGGGEGKVCTDKHQK
ncbi:MAG: hypothetical protein HZA30_01325 [Candidatus Omnitrophica bacterium]|nr:hypothetical protein [Candidatus Omnitrophota bacterium]